MFGPQPVRGAANATLKAPKNSVGGLATRSPVEIGEFVTVAIPEPVLSIPERGDEEQPARICDCAGFRSQYAADHATGRRVQHGEMNWRKAFTVYNQLVAKYGEENVWNAARSD